MALFLPLNFEFSQSAVSFETCTILVFIYDSKYVSIDYIILDKYALNIV